MITSAAFFSYSLLSNLTKLGFANFFQIKADLLIPQNKCSILQSWELYETLWVLWAFYRDIELYFEIWDRLWENSRRLLFWWWTYAKFLLCKGFAESFASLNDMRSESLGLSINSQAFQLSGKRAFVKSLLYGCFVEGFASLPDVRSVTLR